jgi:hypothetical protein
VWAGGADPLQTRESAKANDESIVLLSKLLTGIELSDSGAGLLVKEIQAIAESGKGEGADCLREAIAEVCGDKFNSRTFGNRLSSYRDRVYDGRYLTSSDARGGVQRWRVRPAESGFGGFGGLNSPQSNLETHVSHQTSEPDYESDGVQV